MKRLFLSLFLFSIVPAAYAQFYPLKYRPPALNWQQLKTPHFNIVFPDGEDSVALRSGQILENEYANIRELVGGELKNFPVVLNNYNDLSNGFVTPLHFRSEIEIPPVKGKSMNPRSGSWLEFVAPHELVHALHYSHLDGIWADFLNLVSPDVARSMHSAIPFGVHEGIATYYETTGLLSGGGRGNYPYFLNQFNSVFLGGDRWSMGQMTSSTSYTRPFNRHYLGGYEFTLWLQDEYGTKTTFDAIDYYIRWPFLGYGFALKKVTGQWPGELYSRFEEQKEKTLLSGQNDSTYYSYSPIPIPFKGRELRRPLWLSEHKLLVYGSFYNARPGFYIYDLRDDRFTRIIETRIVQDFLFDLSADRSELLFSNYRPSPIYDRAFKMELYSAKLSSRNTKRLSVGLRAHAPVFHGEDIFALQTDHDSNALVQLDTMDSAIAIKKRLSLPDTRFISIKSNPSNTDQLAVVANRRGVQGLWLASVNSLERELAGMPDISFTNGSVFDPAWHPSGDRLLFSSDYTGTLQIYEFDLPGKKIQQVTGSAFNAMEASYSPDGNTIAFISQYGNERLPVVLNRSNFFGRVVSSSEWVETDKKRTLINRAELGTDFSSSSGWTTSDFRPGLSWLAPRTIFPDIDNVSNTGTYKIGVGLYSNDLLQKNLYQLDLSVVQNLFWYTMTYRHTGFFPGFEVNLFNEPTFPVVSLEFPNESVFRQRMLQQFIGGSLSFPFRFILEQNTRLSSISFNPEFKLMGTRYYELDHNGSPASNFAKFLVGSFSSRFNYKLQQNIRDVQPNTGLVLYSEIEHNFNDDSLTVNTLDNRFQLAFDRPTGLRGGAFLFISPFRRWNQSLRIGVEAITQTSGVFNNQSLVSDGFSEAVFPQARNLMSFNTRYTIPLIYPDDGGFLLPFYLSNIYLVGFSDTILDIGNNSLNDIFTASRNVVGLGVRTKFRISNFAVDLGVAVAVEPTRKKMNIFLGDF